VDRFPFSAARLQTQPTSGFLFTVLATDDLPHSAGTPLLVPSHGIIDQHSGGGHVSNKDDRLPLGA